jgi:GNAT superfamily N-acetyltransferase
MESTEHVQDDARVVGLSERQLPACLELSKSANWNQNEADWRLMLGFGRGWGITLEDGTLAASTLVLPYGERFAWVAMVLVLPEHRRRGFATQLLKKALNENSKSGLASILDATPAGHEVYLQEGFKDTWSFKRFSLSNAFSAEKKNCRPIIESDWSRILELDRRAFGANREVVLRNLAQRLPQAALVSDAGFVFGREGREATQIGPLVARDGKSARELLEAALGNARGPVYVDVADHAVDLQAWIQAKGFALQRPFTRMVHAEGEARAPGEAGLVYCPAGPELG